MERRVLRPNRQIMREGKKERGGRGGEGGEREGGRNAEGGRRCSIFRNIYNDKKNVPIIFKN